MAVPDWPSTYGYNLFLYPWQTWLFGPWDLFVEHGHRLLAATVGLLTILLLVALWRGDSRWWMRWLGVVALAGVVLQGLLGGMRVLMDQRLLARVHGCLGPAFFAYLVGMTLATSPRWRSALPAVAVPGARRFQWLAATTTALVYLQIVVGAHLRHQSLSASPATFQVLVIFHLALALAIVIHGLMLTWRAARLPAELSAVSRPTIVLAMLIVAQLVLGASTWIENYGWPAGAESYAIAAGHTVWAQSQLQALVTTAHVALGSLILAASVTVTLRSARWQHRDETTARSPFPARSTLGTRPFEFFSAAGGAV